MKKSNYSLEVLSKSIKIITGLKASKIKGGRDHHDNDGIPPDEEDR